LEYFFLGRSPDDPDPQLVGDRDRQGQANRYIFFSAQSPAPKKDAAYVLNAIPWLI
jgi:hypothetical protein